MSKLSHVDEQGRARMVDVTPKEETHRVAKAAGTIRMKAATLDAIRGNQISKGDVLGVARVAGVMAAKKTADLIPLCHPLPLHDIDIQLALDPGLPGVRVEATSQTIARTGVEMEALTAVSVTLLTIYDMAKAMDREMVIGDIVLLAKTGGKTGPYSRLDGTSPAP